MTTDRPITLREITDDNRDAITALSAGAAEGRFVASVAKSFVDAAESPEGHPWYRAIYAGEEPVGFVMLSWDVTPQPGIFGPWFLWRLLIDERFQGRGYGRETVRQLTDIVRANGGTELLTSYVPGDDGPGTFYEKLGFVPTGEMDGGEIVIRLVL
ncbi:MAG: GNAT family N-acetyltransferase [Chloroflexota bacterium]